MTTASSRLRLARYPQHRPPEDPRSLASLLASAGRKVRRSEQCRARSASPAEQGYHSGRKIANQQRLTDAMLLGIAQFYRDFERRYQEAEARVEVLLQLPYPPPRLPKEVPETPTVLPRGWILPSGYQIP